ATITENCDGLSAGIHNYTLYAVDTYGNHASMTILVTVIPDVPSINEPADIAYQLGTIGHNVTWFAVDNNPLIYRIFLDDVEDYSATWVGSEITYNIDGHSIGTYNYTLYVEDSDGHHASDTVMVEVVDDSTTPVIDHPEDIVITLGTTGANITWSPTDSYPDWYYIYQNGTLVKNDSWTSTIHVSLDGLGIGVYNYTIIVTDVAENSATDMVYVTVTDNSAPTILNEPDDRIFNEGETGHLILWNVTDLNPDVYIVYVNDTVHSSGSWENPWMFEFVIEYPLFGVWNYTLFVNDTTGYSSSDSVIVTIRDVTLPIVNHPSDMTIVFGVSGNSIRWVATDNNPLAYILTRNGTLIVSGEWSSGEAIELSLDGLLPGVYVFSIVVTDQAGNMVIDDVTVTVTDTTSSTTTDTTTPPTTATPSDILTVISLIITIGSVVVIVIIIVMIVRSRRPIYYEGGF
ncbi:MAG: hypothetical protein P1Q69_18500, partial [Candidatus Thorarchaeota archaeon]|nr:hypothetical protein [Candidatus Thorarchaeota archaeon]